MELATKTFTVAYNAGPGTLAYPGPRSGEERDLILKPWRHTPVPEYFLGDLRFRQDAKAGKFELKSVDELPLDDHFKLDEKFDNSLSPAARQMALSICSEEYKADSRGMNRFKDFINLPDQIGPNGRPRGDSKVTVRYLKETHRYFLEAVLDLENRWQKRKNVLRDVRAALKKIEAL